MVHTTPLVAAALLAALPAVNAGLYSKSSPVVQITGKNYDSLIAQSNYTSIVEFYAPWCGHCKNLQPAFEKAAKNLKGLAKVAAVDCDEESNKQFCGGFGVQGFPTLKIVKPGKTPGRPIVEDYQGPRTAKGIVDAVIDKIPNHVKKVEDKNLEAWLAEANQTAKAILFTDKGKTSPMMKALAIDFKGSISVAQIRDTQKASVGLFGITDFPTLILLPGGKEAEGIVYDGELKKEAIVKFLSQAAAPNPDPAPAKAKASKPKDAKKDPKAKESFEKSSASQASKQGETAAAGTATDETIIEEATEIPQPEVETEKPAVLPDPAPPIGLLNSVAELQAKCLGPRTGTCVLVVLPPTPDELGLKAVKALSEIAHRHWLHKRNTFPFYAITAANPGHQQLDAELGLESKLEVIAVNGRRGWWKQLPKADSIISEKDLTEDAIENWVDLIKLGEGAKKKIPEGLIPEEVEEPIEEPIEEAQQPLKEESKAEEVLETVEEPVESHDEL